jgi:excinuclease UvrABC ATPase subunit
VCRHVLEVIKTADWIIDPGLESNGGESVAAVTPDCGNSALN